MLAEKFGMEYIDVDGSRRTPYIIHRTSIGCYERTLALLIEKYAGALPCWLMPTQVVVMPITDRTADYAKSIAKNLEQAGIRVETDLRNEKIGYKIREAQLEKIPYMLIIGDKEAEAEVVAVRSRSEGDLGTMKYDEFLGKITFEIATMAK
jgi:threonyl-tRNA synthetase